MVDKDPLLASPDEPNTASETNDATASGDAQRSLSLGALGRERAWAVSRPSIDDFTSWEHRERPDWLDMID